MHNHCLYFLAYLALSIFASSLHAHPNNVIPEKCRYMLTELPTQQAPHLPKIRLANYQETISISSLAHPKDAMLNQVLKGQSIADDENYFIYLANQARSNPSSLQNISGWNQHHLAEKLVIGALDCTQNKKLSIEEGFNAIISTVELHYVIGEKGILSTILDLFEAVHEESSLAYLSQQLSLATKLLAQKKLTASFHKDIGENLLERLITYQSLESLQNFRKTIPLSLSENALTWLASNAQ